MNLQEIKKRLYVAKEPNAKISALGYLAIAIGEYLLDDPSEESSMNALPEGYTFPEAFSRAYLFVSPNTLTKYCRNGEFKGFCCKRYGKWYFEEVKAMGYFLRNPRYRRKIDAANNFISGMVKN